jgi:hypothetical protein
LFQGLKVNLKTTFPTLAMFLWIILPSFRTKIFSRSKWGANFLSTGIQQLHSRRQYARATRWKHDDINIIVLQWI